MEVWSFCFLNWWFIGSMLIFQGVWILVWNLSNCKCLLLVWSSTKRHDRLHCGLEDASNHEDFMDLWWFYVHCLRGGPATGQMTGRWQNTRCHVNSGFTDLDTPKQTQIFFFVKTWSAKQEVQHWDSSKKQWRKLFSSLILSRSRQVCERHVGWIYHGKFQWPE